MDHQEVLSTLLQAEIQVGKARRAVELFFKDGIKDILENNSVERSQSGLTNSKGDTSLMSPTITQTAEYTKSGISTMKPVRAKRKLVNTIPRDVNFASEIDVSLSKRPRTNVVDSERIEVIDLTQEYANEKSLSSTMDNGVPTMKLSLGISSIPDSVSTHSRSLDEHRNGEEIESWERETNKDKVLLSGKENAKKSKIGIEDDQGTDEHDTYNDRPGFNGSYTTKQGKSLYEHDHTHHQVYTANTSAASFFNNSKSSILASPITTHTMEQDNSSSKSSDTEIMELTSCNDDTASNVAKETIALDEVFDKTPLAPGLTDEIQYVRRYVHTVKDTSIDSSDSVLDDKAASTCVADNNIILETTISTTVEPTTTMNDTTLGQSRPIGAKRMLNSDHLLSNGVDPMKDVVGEQNENSNKDGNGSDENTNTNNSVGNVIEDCNLDDVAVEKPQREGVQQNSNIKGSVSETDLVYILPDMLRSDVDESDLIISDDTDDRDKAPNVTAANVSHMFGSQSVQVSFTSEQCPARKLNNFQHQESTPSSSSAVSLKAKCSNISKASATTTSKSTTIDNTLTSPNNTLVMDNENSLSKASKDRINDWMRSVAGTTNNSDTLSELALLFALIFQPESKVVDFTTSIADTASNNEAQETIDENFLLASFTVGDSIRDTSLTTSNARLESLGTMNNGIAQKEQEGNESCIFLAQSTPFGSKSILNGNQMLRKGADLENIREAIVSAILEAHLAMEVSTELALSISNNSIVCSERREVESEYKLHVPLENGWKRETVISSVNKHFQMQGNVCYYAPGSQEKLENIEQIQAVLDQHSSDLTADNFSFSARHIIGSFLQQYANETDEKFVRLSDAEVANRLKLITKNYLDVKVTKGQLENGIEDCGTNSEECTTLNYGNISNNCISPMHFDQVENVSVSSVIENVAQASQLPGDDADDDANGEEIEILRNNGTDVDKEKAENEHVENCNGDNLTDTEGRVVDNRKHLSSTSADNENCDSTTTSEKSLGKHKRIRNVQGPHICDICDKQFVYKNSLVSHLKIHTERKLTCAECNKSFTQKSSLSVHMRIHRGEKPFHCLVCKKLFSQKGSLSLHMMIHRGEKPYTCTVCKKSFRHKGNLSDHMRIHRGEKPYTCAECNKSFRLKSTLSDHMRIHNGEKPFHCLVCKKLFSQKGSLSLHMMIHRDEKPYTCSVCKKSFRQKGNLSVHMRIHRGEKPFHCLVCKKLFSQKGSLSLHMMIHRGEKPYTCAECNKSFRLKSTLSVHMMIHRGEKPYTCSECNKSFRDKITFSRHMRINNGVRCTYTCYYCGKNYVKKKDLKDHCVKCYKSQSVGKLTKSPD